MTTLLVLVLLLMLSAMYSGSETGVYSLSRLRLIADVREGRRRAKILAWLTRRDTAILITLLIGNNLMLELGTHLAQVRVDAWEALPGWGRELFVTLLLTPIVFVFGEVLPKDLFRRRPHALLYRCSPLLALSRIVFLPLALPLQALSTVVDRALGIRGHELARALGREEVLDVLRQGAREGALTPQAEALARNVLVLRETPVASVMVPWAAVEVADLDLGPAEVRMRIEDSGNTRLPALRREGTEGVRVVGYLHQLHVLVAPEADPASLLRPLPALPSALPVDKALNKMRISGQRMALVGSPEAPEGLVTLMDLIAALSRDPVP